MKDHKCRECDKEDALYQCTCLQYLCSDRCIKEHTGGYTIEEMKEIEGNEFLTPEEEQRIKDIETGKIKMIHQTGEEFLKELNGIINDEKR